MPAASHLVRAAMRRCGSPRCRTALPRYAGPYRLRRVLRHRREARQSGARRQAGDHRRRQARRGVGGLLHLPNLRRALGDADVQGAGAVPVRRRDPARHGEIRPGRPRGAPCHAGADAAGRAAVDRRGVSRSRRHPARPRHDPGQGAGALCPRGRARHRHHGVGRPVLQQVPGQDRLRPRQAARLCGARPGRGARDARGQAGRLHFRRRARRRRSGCRSAAFAPSPICSAPTKST